MRIAIAVNNGGHILDGGGVVHGRVKLGVGHAQSAAQVQLLHLISALGLDGGDELHHNVGGLGEGIGVEDLGADVAMEARQMDVGLGESQLDDVHSLSRLNGGAELGVHRAGHDGLVGMGIDTGGDAEQDALGDASCSGVGLHRQKLVGIVHHEGTHAHVHGIVDIPFGLVVAVEVDALGREARTLGGIQLATRYAVHAHALLGGDPVDPREAQSLGGVERQRVGTEVGVGGVQIGAHHGADGILVHDVGGGAVGLGQLQSIQPADGEVAVLIDGKMVIQKVHGKSP